MRRLLITVFVITLGGCLSGPDSRQLDVNLPEQWPEPVQLSKEDGVQWRSWWTRFDDPVLDGLIQRALSDSLDLQSQLARLEAARAQLGLARAERMPTIDAQLQALRERLSAAAFGLDDEFVLGIRNLFGATAALSYELDLWGRLARQQEAAGARWQAVIFESEAVELALITELVVTYFDHVSALGGMAGLERSAELRERKLALEQLRYDAGAIDVDTLEQARTEYAAARARLASQRHRIVSTATALAVLVGEEPQGIVEFPDYGEKRLIQLAIPTQLPEVLPSTLLRRRPDLRAAEAELIAANADVGVAAADRLPRLNLSLQAGWLAADQADLFDSRSQIWTIGSSVAAPLFDFGRRKRRVEIAEAMREQAELRYRQTVRTAFREVRDAMSLFETTADNFTQLETQYTSALRVRDLMQLRYDAGQVSQQTYLDADYRRIEAALAWGIARLEHMSAIATLFKALGGGWEFEQQLSSR